MSLTHPIGDLLTRIRNGQNAGKEFVRVPASKLRTAVLSVLKDEGYITDFREEQVDSRRKNILIELKYIDGNG
ncbi:MAG: 30S ribosomal protein S8, partial [Alphaproteobacteria bacterium]|nr:30S ribosomal protein S8 [Alphaproteobacteria bacterium]